METYSTNTTSKLKYRISVSPLPDKSQNYQIYKRLDGGGWLYLAEWSALALHRNDILKAVKRYYKMWGG